MKAKVEEEEERGRERGIEKGREVEGGHQIHNWNA